MSYHDRLRAEINATLDGLETAGEPLVAAWVTHSVCGKHSEGLAANEHAQFWQHGGYRTVRNEVRLCINERRGDRADRKATQSWLPGFDHLQPYYMVERNGDEIGVPTPDLTDDELDGKAALYRRMGAACYAHADEIERYKIWRTQGTAGAA